MPEATYRGAIRRSAADVFDFVSDAENNPRWHEHVRETRWIDDGPTRLGRRGRQTGHLWGRDWAFVAEVAEWDPPRLVAFQVIEGYRVRTTIRVEPSDTDPETVSVITLTVRTPRILGRRIDALIGRAMKAATRGRERGDFARLRAALEDGRSAP